MTKDYNIELTQKIITDAFEKRAELSRDHTSSKTIAAIDHTIERLNSGELRVAEKKGGEWITHQWIKKAVLLYFKLHANQAIDGGFTQYYDKVPLKYAHTTTDDFNAQGVRVVPPCNSALWRLCRTEYGADAQLYQYRCIR